MYTLTFSYFGKSVEINHNIYISCILFALPNCLYILCYLAIIHAGSHPAVIWHDSWLREVQLELLLAFSWNLGNWKLYNLDPAQKNQAFASSYFYLQLWFQNFLVFGDSGLAAKCPPAWLAVRHSVVRVHHQWREAATVLPNCHQGSLYLVLILCLGRNVFFKFQGI